MVVVETIAKVRRAYFVEGQSIKGICRDLRLSPKVVRKVVRTHWSFAASAAGPEATCVG